MHRLIVKHMNNCQRIYPTQTEKITARGHYTFKEILSNSVISALAEIFLFNSNLVTTFRENKKKAFKKVQLLFTHKKNHLVKEIPLLLSTLSDSACTNLQSATSLFRNYNIYIYINQEQRG